jgi:excisionase family DNA binding protein
MNYITPKEFYAKLEGRLSLSAIYRMLKRGDLPSARVGKRFLIPEDVLDQLVAAAKEPQRQDAPDWAGNTGGSTNS